MQDGENEVLSASKNTTHTMSFPMCLSRCSCNKGETYTNEKERQQNVQKVAARYLYLLFEDRAFHKADMWKRGT